MSGVKGAGGPVPKRTDQRRRPNVPAVPVDRVERRVSSVPVPRADPGWHPVASRFYRSLARSAQSEFYEPSDWAAAWMLAESMSREFEAGSPGGNTISAWLRAMTVLLVTEGDRRRLRLEVVSSGAKGGAAVEESDVSWIDEARRRLREPG